MSYHTLSELPSTVTELSNLHSYNCLKCRNAGRWHIYVIRPDEKMPISKPVRHRNDPVPDWDDLCQNANTGDIGLESRCPAMLSCNYTKLGLSGGRRSLLSCSWCLGISGPYTVQKRLSIFPSPAGMSLTKLSLAGNNLIVHGQGEFGQWHPGWGWENL